MMNDSMSVYRMNIHILDQTYDDQLCSPEARDREVIAWATTREREGESKDNH